MVKHFLLWGLLLSLGGFGAAAGAADAADAADGTNARNDRAREQIMDIAGKNNRRATYDVSAVDDLQSLTPTQSARKLLSIDAPLRVRWALPLHGAQVRRISVPPYGSETKYFLVETVQNDLIAVYSDNGAPAWWVKYQEPIVGEIHFGDANISFISGNRLIGIDNKSGEVRWNVALPFAPAAGPSSDEDAKKPESGCYFIPGMDRKIYCMSVAREEWPPKAMREAHGTFAVTLSRANRMWSYSLAGISHHTPAYDKEDNALYLGTLNKRLYGINIEGAALAGAPMETNVWEYHSMGDTTAAPIIDGTNVIFPSLDQYLYCLNNDTGTVAWRYMAKEPLMQSPQLLHGSELGDPKQPFMVVQRVGKETLVGLNNLGYKEKEMKASAKGQQNKNNFVEDLAHWQHDKGLQIVGISRMENAKPDMRFIAISLDNDNHLTGILAEAEDTRTPQEIRDDETMQRHMTAKIAWRLPIDKFTAFAPNVAGNFVFCATADRGTVCVLERNK